VKKTLVLLCLVVMLFAFVTGCGSDTSESIDTSEDENGVVDEPVEGGIIVVGEKVHPTTHLWHQVRAVWEIAYSSLTQETLMRYNDSGVPEPFLLESLEPNREENTWTLKVREGIKFSDGSDLNAEVVAWNINIYREKGIFAESFFAPVDYAEAVDDYTVIVNMSSWDSLFPYTLARSCLIASKEAFDTYGEEYLGSNPIGTGPFVLDVEEHDVRLVYSSNPYYWRGVPKVDGVEVVIYENELVMQAAMEAGELHAMNTTNYDLVNNMANSQTGFTIYSSAVPSSAYTLCFNMSDPNDPFSNILVRQAASYAVDRDAIVDALMYGYGSVSNQWGTEDSEFYNPQVEGQPYNLEKALELMAEAGYADGFSTTLTYPSHAISADYPQAIAEMLAAIGINVTLRPAEGAGFVNFIGGWEEGMLLHPMGMENGAASQLASTFVQGLGFALGVESFIHPDDLDQMIREATVAPEDEVAGIFREVQKVVFDDYVFMKTIAVVHSTGITRPEVQEHDYCKVQDRMHSFYKAWFKE